MKKIGFVLTAAALAAFTSHAEDEASETAEKPAAEAESANAAAPKTAASEPAVKPFTTLPLCRRVQGTAEVLCPGAESWVVVEEGRFYPLGSSYRTRSGSTLVVAFGSENTVTVSENSSFSSREQKLGLPSRGIVLGSGKITVELVRNLAEGAFTVSAPGFLIKNPAGKAEYEYVATGDGYAATVRCVTGTLSVEGRHFSIAKMGAANAFRIRTSHDELASILHGVSGDYVIRLDRGLVTRREVNEDGSTRDLSEPSFLDWHLSPETSVQIIRAVPAVGKRLSVTVMTFDTAGTLKNNFAFAEGRIEVNSGELVAAPKEEREELARRAAAATEEKAAETTEEKAADATEENSAESSET